MMEALACHPLDTIKVRMQLSRRARAPGVSGPCSRSDEGKAKGFDRQNREGLCAPVWK